jgi:hypothetical protein
VILFHRKKIIIMPAENSIYMISYYKNWHGRCVMTEAAVFPCNSPDWFKNSEKIIIVISQLCKSYKMQHCGITIILGGEKLLLKRIQIPSKKHAAAFSSMEWDEIVNDNERKIFDVAYIGAAADGMNHYWMAAVYPYDLIMAFCTAFRQEENIVDRIDTLPSLLSQFYNDLSGTLYCQAETGTHVCVYDRGGLNAYQWYDGIPKEFSQWVEDNKKKDMPYRPLVKMREKWMLPCIQKDCQKKLSNYHLQYPAAFFLPLL